MTKVTRQPYNAIDLKGLIGRCRSIVNRNGDLGIDVAHAFYWILRGRPLAEIVDLHPAADMDGVVFPFIRSYLSAITAENCDQLIGNRAERLKILEKIKATQAGATFYNLNVVDKDPNLPWEVIEQVDSKWNIRIGERKEAKPKRFVPKKTAATNAADPTCVGHVSKVVVVPVLLPLPMAVSRPRAIRTSFRIDLTTTTPKQSLTEFLRSKGCRNFADAIREVCRHIGLSLICDDILARFSVSPQSGRLTIQRSAGSKQSMLLFNGGFSEYFTSSASADDAAQRIFNVVNALAKPETVTASEALGYTRRSIPSELAPGGKSVHAVRAAVCAR
ncbi:MAG: hypothetical protein EYC62_05200 [Alphaproteobacteria bacterium]|nr:MAG: hypothetical protein EYC62_05200 [Alphaproteobacteria bacterium]